MIESSYWREELRADIRWLRTNQTYKRWSEKQLVLYERKLLLTAFQIRSLLERPKVNDRARSLKLQSLEYPKVSSKPFTVIGSGYPHEHFDPSLSKVVHLSIWDVCNQLIHYYWMSTASERCRFTSTLVFSDYKRNTCAYEFDVSSMIELFAAFGDDDSAVTAGRFVWNERKQDFILEDAR